MWHFPPLSALHSTILFVMKFKPAVFASFDGFRLFLHFEDLDEADVALLFIMISVIHSFCLFVFHIGLVYHPKSAAMSMGGQ